ncbi:hypothetical protein D3C78_741790 [compost metagenome]
MEKATSCYNCDYVRRHYNVPAEIERRAIANGEPGVVIRRNGREATAEGMESHPALVRLVQRRTLGWRRPPLGATGMGRDALAGEVPGLPRVAGQARRCVTSKHGLPAPRLLPASTLVYQS